MSTKTMKPMYDRVLIEPKLQEDRTAAGIYIPDTAKEKPIRGTVVAVGHGYRNSETGAITPLTLKVGDVVLYGKWSGTEVKDAGHDYIVMKESDILALIQ